MNILKMKIIINNNIICIVSILLKKQGDSDFLCSTLAGKEIISMNYVGQKNISGIEVKI